MDQAGAASMIDEFFVTGRRTQKSEAIESGLEVWENNFEPPPGAGWLVGR